MLVAHVLAHTPAFEAGIRDGDVLLKIEDLDVTKWRTLPGILPLARFWTRPPGTRLGLTLKRQSNLYRATLVLREILSADIKPT
jgi:C-terminal processing protease CtpA/Prc